MILLAYFWWITIGCFVWKPHRKVKR